MLIFSVAFEFIIFEKTKRMKKTILLYHTSQFILKYIVNIALMIKFISQDFHFYIRYNNNLRNVMFLVCLGSSLVYFKIFLKMQKYWEEVHISKVHLVLWVGVIYLKAGHLASIGRINHLPVWFNFCSSQSHFFFFYILTPFLESIKHFIYHLLVPASFHII